MRQIILEIDDISAEDYDNFTYDMKKQVCNELKGIIGKMIFDKRVTKLKKLVDEINSSSMAHLDPQVMMALLRIEEDDNDDY